MTSSLIGKKILILAANGFDENQMTEMQRALIKVKAEPKTVTPEQGVVNGWQGASWGHYFPVDMHIGETLGSDFDILVIPGGERGVTKLKTNPHTRRIVNHFMEAGKPIAAIGAGVSLLGLSAEITGHTVAAPLALQDELETLGALISENEQEIDDTILTSNGENSAAWVEAALVLFAGQEEEEVSVAA